SVIGIDKEMLNFYLYDYLKNLPQDDKNKLSLANSIWFTDDERFTVNQDFLQTNADYYGADIYKAPFNSQTCKDINNWVNKKTDKMIPEILDKIPAEAVMYLVNALAFEAEWEEIYKKDQVKNGVFTKSDGTKQETKFMYSDESFYLEDQNAKGFIKYYKGGKYAFVAMLPNENVSLENYVASLDGKTLYGLLQNPKPDVVNAAIPKFETEYSTELVDTLIKMGMPKAFNDTLAQFQGLGTSTAGNIYIGRVLHKTFISVSEKGTKAGAATLIEMTDNAAPAEPKRVYLNRPFVYMLIDTQNKIPFFIGTMNDIKK
ncbi:MAG: serpin family protein, partial [Clostridia bacterium]|nr:serpin family protein [Clostridia bacterium]